jgi:hypothetical protein
MAVAAGCGFAHDLVHIAACPVLPFQLETFKLLIEQALQGMPFGRVHETIAIPVNDIPLEGCSLGQCDRHLDSASVQISVAGQTFQRGEVFVPRGQCFMRHIGVTGGAILFFLLGVDVMAIFAFKALGVMDARRVPLGRPFVTVGAGRARELFIVRDGFDITVAAYAREVAVDGFFLEGLMAVETIFRLDSSMKGRSKKDEEEKKNQHDRWDIYIEPNMGDLSKRFKKSVSSQMIAKPRILSS